MGRASAMPACGAGSLRRLKKRSQFLRAARGNRAGRSAFLLQAIGSEDAEPGLGFTVTKKTGNAPERNRIKRRLREAARACEAAFRPQHDYVLVGRRDALTLRFDRLIAELSGAVAKIHETKIHASKAASLRDDK